MPTTRVDREVSLEEAESVLSEALGAAYHVSRKPPSSLVVRRNGLVGATVRVGWTGGTTTFKVSGTGLILARVANSLGIARRVRDALDRRFTGVTTS